jgi:hypothetical protein
VRQVVLGAIFTAVLGCGVPGTPTPRRPVIPLPVNDLVAQQRGDAVVLRFTLPKNSIEQEALAEPPAVDIYRGTSGPGIPANGASGQKSSSRLVDTIPSDAVNQYEQNGQVEFLDPLDPGDISSAPGRQWTYTVRARVSAAHPSADSNSVTVRVYPPPEAIGDLRATLMETAVVLAWTPPERTAGGAPIANITGYHVYRAEVTPETSAAAVQDASQAKLVAPLALLGPATGPEYRDTTFAFGHTYLYTVRTVTQFGSDSFESAGSKPFVISAKDVFPPATPQGVEVVVVPATPGTPAYVELTWDISPEADLAGYTVYRSEQPDTEGQRLNAELLPAPTFRDISVVPGRRYYYRVGAADRSGNESARSPAIAAEVPGP